MTNPFVHVESTTTVNPFEYVAPTLGQRLRHAVLGSRICQSFYIRRYGLCGVCSGGPVEGHSFGNELCGDCWDNSDTRHDCEEFKISSDCEHVTRYRTLNS